MKPSLPLRILVAGAGLALALVGLVVAEGQARARGQEVRLAMEAFDPRSLLTGHYAALQLVHALPEGVPCPDGGDQGWLALTPNGPVHRLAGAAATREAALKLGPVAVRGEASCLGGEPTRVALDIGIDRIHADQEEAQAIEAALRGGPEAAEAVAIVSVGRDGRARLKGVIAGGRRTDLDWF
ncbi:MAG: GDYXXLXY domain-containing protein [Phenylobacterium sp.]|uniref:GDYXXLXY domain-containing protein n=1 Tax=Phenylobacterium sp. TaxID=1871053 RepID=UPI002A32E3B8|nr:GDYXXLXY domain-containing protein [Phenylobacterium sp.]MDD3838078.1 GDYXXLXY domain-containing protein [Phenylobacterium sp.]MDX9999131.1 GDYXXLXY domain-containing protein [Phenylobacterium sp.]